jgi:hypothetical protein
MIEAIEESLSITNLLIARAFITRESTAYVRCQ